MGEAFSWSQCANGGCLEAEDDNGTIINAGHESRELPTFNFLHEHVFLERSTKERACTHDA